MKVVIISSIILTLLYVFLIPVELKEANEIVERQYLSINELQNLELAANDEELFFLDLGSFGGYLSADLKRGTWLPNKYQFVENGTNLINYSPRDSQIFIWDQLGQIITEIPNTGIPFLGDEYLVILKESSLGVQWYNLFGELLEERNYTKLITALDLQSDVLALGFIDGSVEIIDLEVIPGTLPKVNVTVPLVSHSETREPEVIYGLRLLNEARILALVSGREPQQFQVFQLSGQDSNRVLKEDLPITSISPVWMKNTESHGLYFEIQNDLFHFEANENQFSWIPIPPGNIESIESLDPRYLTMMVQSNSGSNMAIFDAKEQLLLSQQSTEFLKLSARENSLYISHLDGLGILRFKWSGGNED